MIHRPAGAPPPAPRRAAAGPMARLIAALGPHATALRVAGGLLTLIGTLLPWATFVLNDGPYPDKSTFNSSSLRFGVTGFRLHLLLFGIAALVLTLAPVRRPGRLLRGLAWGIIGIAVVNGSSSPSKGGGLGAITAADGSVAFGAVVTLLGRRRGRLGARRGRDRTAAGLDVAVLPVGRAGRAGRRLTCCCCSWWPRRSPAAGTAAQSTPTRARCSSPSSARSAARSRPCHASGLMSWVATVAERHRMFSVVVLLAIALGLPLTAAGNEYWMTVAANIGVYAATAIGLNIVVGLAGLLDLGYVAFLGIGAFTAANLSGAAAAKFDVHLPFPIVMVICAVVAGCFGAIVGSPTLRVRGDYLAIVTLAFGEIFTRIAQNNIGGLTGGANAIPGHPAGGAVRYARSTTRSASPRSSSPSGVLYYVLIVLLVAFVMLVFAHLKDSRLGRAWIAIREDEDAARAMGIRTGPIKILAFLSVPCSPGSPGAFFAHKTGTVSLRQLPVHRVGDVARGRHPRRDGDDARRGAGCVAAVRPAREAARVRRLPAAAVRPRAHRAHAAPPAGPRRPTGTGGPSWPTTPPTSPTRRSTGRAGGGGRMSARGASTRDAPVTVRSCRRRRHDAVRRAARARRRVVRR